MHAIMELHSMQTGRNSQTGDDVRLQSFIHDGKPAWGVRHADYVTVLTAHWPDVCSALAVGPDALARACRLGGPQLPATDLHWLAPVVAPRKILCVGLNDARHVRETGRPLPAYPSIFTRYADSLVGHGCPLWHPRVSEQFDFEAELAVVIGRSAWRIAERDAFDYVAGYACMAENSVRDWQKHSAQVTPGKNFFHSGALGPWLVTADEIADPTRLRVTSRVNGEPMQDGCIADLIFSIPALMAYVSAFTPLSPGDVIATGTPAGVGAARTPPRFLRAGDVLEVEIPGVGTLVNPVIDEPDTHNETCQET